MCHIYEVKLQLKLSFGQWPEGFIAAFFFMVSAYLCVDVYIRRRWSEMSFVGLPFQVSWEYAQYMSCLFVCVRVRAL